MPAGDLPQHRRLQIAESRLAHLVKQFWNRAARHPLHAGVGIEKAIAQGCGQGPTDGALARAHHSHQVEIQALQSPRQVAVGGVGHRLQRYRCRF